MIAIETFMMFSPLARSKLLANREPNAVNHSIAIPKMQLVLDPLKVPMKASSIRVVVLNFLRLINCLNAKYTNFEHRIYSSY